MKLIAFTCSNCGAALETDPEKKMAFCPFCGAKLLIDDESIKITQHIVDEARLKEAEVRLRELEYQRERELREETIRQEQKKARVLSIGVYLVVMGIFLAVPWLRTYFILVLLFGLIALVTTGRSDSRGRAERKINYRSRKSRTAALLICIFFGEFGAHYFYAGRPVMGVIYLLTFGFLGIGWFIDIIRIACGVFRDNRGFYL